MIHQRMGTYRAKTSSVKQLGYGGRAGGIGLTPWSVNTHDLRERNTGTRKMIAQRPQRRVSLVVRSWSVDTVASEREAPERRQSSHRGHGGGSAEWLELDPWTSWLQGEKHRNRGTIARRSQREWLEVGRWTQWLQAINRVRKKSSHTMDTPTRPHAHTPTRRHVSAYADTFPPTPTRLTSSFEHVHEHKRDK
jgi:hypothetical protein